MTPAVTLPAARSVLILRPHAAAAEAAEQIRKRGLQPFIMPLYAAQTLPQTWQDIFPPDVLPHIISHNMQHTGYTALLASSANAITALPKLPPALQAALAQLPFYCVGSKTGAAAVQSGFTNIRYSADTAEDLCRFIKQETVPKNTRHITAGGYNAPQALWLYLAGKPRRHTLEAFLSSESIPHHTAEIYETAFCPPTAIMLQALPPHLDYILLYSAVTATHLASLHQHISASTQILCLSARIKDALPPKLQNAARIAEKPRQDALLALLPQK